jgi:Flp pilus assembly protein TadD
MPYRAAAKEALDAWRDAQRRLATSPPDSPEWQQAYIDEQLAKGAYQQAIEGARRAHLPEPPPFNEATAED